MSLIFKSLTFFPLSLAYFIVYSLKASAVSEMPSRAKDLPKLIKKSFILASSFNDIDIYALAWVSA